MTAAEKMFQLCACVCMCTLWKWIRREWGGNGKREEERKQIQFLNKYKQSLANERAYTIWNLLLLSIWRSSALRIMYAHLLGKLPEHKTEPNRIALFTLIYFYMRSELCLILVRISRSVCDDQVISHLVRSTLSTISTRISTHEISEMDFQSFHIPLTNL